MEHAVDDELRTICREIQQDNRTVAERAEIEATDWFQTAHYCGGFDATDMQFTFSVTYGRTKALLQFYTEGGAWDCSRPYHDYSAPAESLAMTPGYNPKSSERFLLRRLEERCWDCPCCGVPVQCVLVKVFEDSNGIAVAAVHWATHESEDTILLLISVGDWNRDSDGADRVAYGFSCEVGAELIGMRSIDASEATISERDNFGEKLCAYSARESAEWHLVEDIAFTLVFQQPDALRFVSEIRKRIGELS